MSREMKQVIFPQVLLYIEGIDLGRFKVYPYLVPPVIKLILYIDSLQIRGAQVIGGVSEYKHFQAAVHAAVMRRSGILFGPDDPSDIELQAKKMNLIKKLDEEKLKKATK